MLANLLVCTLMLGNPVQDVDAAVVAAATPQENVIEVDNAAEKFWSKKNSLRLGYDFHDFQNESGAYMPIKFSVGLVNNHNVWLHKKPIGGVLKFGFDHGFNVGYSMFDTKLPNDNYNGPLGYIGSGSIDGDEYASDMPNIGMHYVSLGYGLGLSATIKPVAQLRLNGYCHFVPSAALIISNSEINVGFMPYMKYGAELSYNWIGVGVEWGTGVSKMSDVVGQLLSEDSGSSAKKKYYSNYTRIYLTFRLGKNKKK